MHIVYFMEGFGNQLFQLCLYEKLKGVYGSDRVYADISFYETSNIHGGFKLDPLYKLKYIHKCPGDCIRINETNFSTTDYDPDRDYLYVGFWQDERFLPDELGFLSDLLHVNRLNEENQNILRSVEETQSVSVHVRRGDYIDNSVHGNISSYAYFVNAISFMKTKLNDPAFFVFSDDIAWCRENLGFGDSRVEYITGNEKHVELDILMMSSCKHHIISNSSFSWMAQKLNQSTDKIVVSPEYWLNESIPTVDLNKDSFYHVKNYRKVDQAKDRPFFSILIPVLRQDNRLRRSISSVLNQSFDSFEIILADYSPDEGSQRIVDEYAEQDARVVLIKREGSLLTARISAMSLARGKFVLFLDNSVYLSTDALTILHDEMIKEAVDIAGFSCCREPDKTIVCTIPAKADDTAVVIWNRCYSSETIKSVLSNTKPCYCMIGEDSGFSALLFSQAWDYRRIDHVLCHYVRENDEAVLPKTALNEGNDSFYLDLIDTALNAYREQKGSYAESAPELIPLLEEVIKKCSGVISKRSDSSDQSLVHKLLLLKEIDDSLDTHSLSDYENKIRKDREKSARYDDLENGGFRRKAAYAFNAAVLAGKRRIKNLLVYIKNRIKTTKER